MKTTPIVRANSSHVWTKYVLRRLIPLKVNGSNTPHPAKGSGLENNPSLKARTKLLKTRFVQGLGFSPTSTREQNDNFTSRSVFKMPVDYTFSLESNFGQ